MNGLFSVCLRPYFLSNCVPFARRIHQSSPSIVLVSHVDFFEAVEKHTQPFIIHPSISLRLLPNEALLHFPREHYFFPARHQLRLNVLNTKAFPTNLRLVRFRINCATCAVILRAADFACNSHLSCIGSVLLPRGVLLLRPDDDFPPRSREERPSRSNNSRSCNACSYTCKAK